MLNASSIRSSTAVGAIALMLSAAPVRAQVNQAPRELEGVGVTEHLNAQVPREALFRDHNGREVRIGQYFDGRRPVVLNLAYHRCPMLCSMVLNALMRTLTRTIWNVGDQFDVITLSIDPRDTFEVAGQKRERVLRAYNRPTAQRGWHFLQGSESQIRRVTETVGFQYRFDPQQDQYAHAAVTILLTPDGKVARYLYGLEYSPNDMRVGLLEASQGRSISTAERLILYCYHYDPQGQKYVVMAQRVMKLGGAVTVAALSAFLGVMWLRERRRRTDRSGSV
jgi:protein SCO1/2